MIEPSIGRIVWYFADHAATKGMKSTHPDEPFAAIVTAVHTDRIVNLLVFDHQGTTFAMQSVPLFQGDEEDDETAIAHCEWMPYQRGQAERTRLAERGQSAVVSIAPGSYMNLSDHQNAGSVKQPGLNDPLGPSAAAKWPEPTEIAPTVDQILDQHSMPAEAAEEPNGISDEERERELGGTQDSQIQGADDAGNGRQVPDQEQV